MAPEFASHISVSGHEVICIVGMHRSGTSLIAQLLKQSGLYLGSEERLLGSNVGNQDGHFENVEFIDLNDSLLQHLGGSWEHPPELPSGWEKAASLEPQRCELEESGAVLPGNRPGAGSSKANCFTAMAIMLILTSLS